MIRRPIIPDNIQKQRVYLERSKNVPESTIRFYEKCGITDRKTCIQSALNYYDENGYYIDDTKAKLSKLREKEVEIKNKITFYQEELKNIRKEIEKIEE